MLFADDTRGKHFSKDPAVVFFNSRYFLYYSLPPFPRFKLLGDRHCFILRPGNMDY